MYSIIRIVIGGLFLVFSIAVIKRSKTTRKKMFYGFSVFISIAIITVLAFFPFENLFMNFDSAKAAYEYYTFEKSDIVLTVEGNECDLVIDRKNSAHYAYLMIPKTTNGWKIGVGTNDKTVFKTITNGIIIRVDQYKNTNDFFITVYNSQGEETVITDVCNTEFKEVKDTFDELGKSFVTYYAYLPKYNEQYTLTVNGEVITANQ